MFIIVCNCGIQPAVFADIFPLPNINSATALFKMDAIDHYGNINSTTEESFFSISSEEFIFTDTMHVEVGTSMFIIDQIPPEVEWQYPNGGEVFNASEVISTQWSAVDPSFDSTDVSIFFSEVTGGSFETTATNIPNTGNFEFRICIECNNRTLKTENGCDICMSPECGYSKCDK